MEFSQQFLKQLSIEKQQFTNIATWMKSDIPKEIPEVLQGVFFMDGNPLPDDCISLEGGKWRENTLTLTLPIFAPRQWTFHVSVGGFLLLNFVRLAQIVYEINFEDETLVNAQIIPVVWGWRVPTFLANFTMMRSPDDIDGKIWIRKSSWLGGIIPPSSYILTKIVDKEGNYLDAFQDMLLDVADDCLVISP